MSHTYIIPAYGIGNAIGVILAFFGILMLITGTDPDGPKNSNTPKLYCTSPDSPKNPTHLYTSNIKKSLHKERSK